MNNFVFYNPTKILFGKNQIQLLGKEMKSNNVKKVLILAGGGSIKQNGVYDTTIKTLSKEGIESVEVWGVRPNPTLDHANEAIKIARDNHVDAILAIGGGSVIDESKSIAAGFYLDNLWDVFEKKALIEKALPIYTILTLSGTCSEMDPFAVLSNEAEQKKWGMGSPLLFPKVSVIDPSIQMSLPWHQTVNGGIDAISHTMEFYFLGTNEEITISMDEAIINTIIKSIDALQVDSKDYSARSNLAWCATLALNGNSGVALKGGDWASHRIEHGISALHPEVAHGAGLAVVFPNWIKYCASENPAQFKRFAEKIWNCDNIDDAVEKMKSKFRSWGAPTTLRDLNIEKSEIEAIADNALNIGNLGAVKSLTREDVIKILEFSY